MSVAASISYQQLPKIMQNHFFLVKECLFYKKIWIYQKKNISLHSYSFFNKYSLIMKRFLLLPFAIMCMIVKGNELVTDESYIEVASITLPDGEATAVNELYDTLVYCHDTIIVHIHPRPSSWQESPVRKATSATCATDSVVTKDSIGNNIELVEYFYQDGKDAGSATWKWVKGKRQGVSKTLKSYDSSMREIFNATYTWSTATNDWRGKVCKETTYNSNGKETDSKLYTGVTASGAWKGSTYYHYEYDNSGHTILSMYYIWDDNTNDWTEKDKWEYEFTDGNPSATYFWEKENGLWVGREKKVWVYEGKNIVDEEVYTSWVDGNWIGDHKTVRTYNAQGQITEQLTYTWLDGWIEDTKIIRKYEGANTIDNATYKKSGNQWIGVSRTTATFEGTAKLTQTAWIWVTDTEAWREVSQYNYTYAYTNKIATQVYMLRQGNTWRNEEKTENLYNSKKYVTQTTISRWQNEAWEDSLQTRHTYNNSNQEILTVSAKWSNGQWLSTDSSRWVMEYVTINGTQKKIYDEKATWSLASGTWKGTSKYTYEYDEAGNTLQYDTYSFTSGKWVNNQRQIYTYKDMKANLKTLEQKMTWNNTQQTWVGNSRTERTYNDVNKQLINATYSWSTAKNDWQGKSKTETVYTNDIQTASITYQWDANAWDWIYKSKTVYVYEGTNQVQQLQLTYNTTNQSFVNQTRYDYSYDQSGRQYRTDVYTWIKADEQWCRYSHTESVYDGSTLRSENSSQWSNCVRQSYDTKYYHYQCDNPTYSVKFLNWDSVQLALVTALEGSTPLYPAELSQPTHSKDAQYTYTFRNWGNGIIAATSDTSYVAVFDSIVNKYMITFTNEDGSIIEAKEYEYGATPVAPAAPTKDATAEYTYSFAGWIPEVVEVTGAATYTATYTATIFTGVDNTIGDQTAVKMVENGILYIVRAGRKYTVYGIAAQ